jgi:hypothetical protein
MKKLEIRGTDGFHSRGNSPARARGVLRPVLLLTGPGDSSGLNKATFDKSKAILSLDAAAGVEVRSGPIEGDVPLTKILDFTGVVFAATSAAAAATFFSSLQIVNGCHIYR